MACGAGRFLSPVAAPVIDGFRPPATAYGPGNRGLTYATAAGSTVTAIGAGTVAFAGRIGAAWYVTIAHEPGLDSTYSFLASAIVRAGDRVLVGQPLGAASETAFHLGIRHGGAYVDPAPLLAAAPRLRPRLIPNARFGDGGGCSRSEGDERRGPGTATWAPPG